MDAEAELRSAFGEGEAVDGADSGGDGTIGVGREGCKIVCSDEVGHGFSHGFDVEGAHDVGMVEALVWGEDAGIPNVVAVFFARGIEAGMEVARYFSAAGDADVRGEVLLGVERHLEGALCHAGDEVYMEDLASGVYAMVGAAAAVDIDFVGFDDVCQNGFDGLLDGGVAGLGLPTVVGGAIIGAGHAKAAWGHWSFPFSMCVGVKVKGTPR